VTIEILTLGEPLVAFVARDGRSLADAIDYRAYVVGAEANVAVGLARLGHSVALVGRVGDDGLGTAILRRLRAEGVDIAGLRVESGAPTGILLRERRSPLPSEVIYRRSGSAGSGLTDKDVARAGDLRGARWVHVTGITAALSSTALAAVDAAIDAARAAGATVSFDVNLRRRLWDDETAGPVVGRLARKADIVLGTPGELVVAAGGLEPAQRLIDAGVALVVTKAGADGAWSLDHAGITRSAAAVRVQWPIDPVGAGDAFCAGFIAARLEGLEDEEALRWGAACGAAAVSVEGDIDGLPSRAELGRLLEAGGDTVR
jgi:2-dehydro-3-deoxygluconokinase